MLARPGYFEWSGRTVGRLDGTGARDCIGASVRSSARSLELALGASLDRVKCYAGPHAMLELGGTFGVVSGGLSDAAAPQLGPRWVSARHPPRPLDARRPDHR